MIRIAALIGFAALVLLSLATGITKLVRLPAEMALFRAAGFSDPLTIAFGVVQTAGGVLLLWVCWKMWRELHMSHHQPKLQSLSAASTIEESAAGGRQKTLSQAVWQITIADVSMSLDNVLAVAGAAREHPMILIFGLALSIALMGLAATFIARLLEKHRWIAYVGLAVILYVALDMIWRGTQEVWPHVKAATLTML